MTISVKGCTTNNIDNVLKIYRIEEGKKKKEKNGSGFIGFIELPTTNDTEEEKEK